MILTIENDYLLVTIDDKGAELSRLFNKQTGLEYLWNADPAIWAKHSPVLFPIVGTLKDDRYRYKGKEYSMTRHGFARDMMFLARDVTTHSISLAISNDFDTRKKFPFDFDFQIKYSLEADILKVTYTVKNSGDSEMYFSVGGHPAFRVPIVAGLEYSDYYLRFDREETAGRWPISAAGLIEEKPAPLLDHSDRLPLTKELFARDAIVLKQLRSTSVSLVSDKSEHGIDLNFNGFPFLGIWAAKQADFVCIEPWCGIADPVNTDQELEHKEGIERLTAAETFTRSWSVRLF